MKATNLTYIQLGKKFYGANSQYKAPGVYIFVTDELEVDETPET